jgi:hypothetical protein
MLVLVIDRCIRGRGQIPSGRHAIPNFGGLKYSRFHTVCPAERRREAKPGEPAPHYVAGTKPMISGDLGKTAAARAKGSV